MSRIALICTAALLGACNAATDDVATSNPETDAAPVESVAASEAVSVCSAVNTLTIADYPDETWPDNAETFHAENANRPGVQTTPSGLQYKVIQNGLENGMSPEAGEYVVANYHGLLIDGTVFDSSYARNEPFEFSTRRVIPGWTEAIEDMTVCEARTLYIPSDIAYGSSGAGNVIPRNATLVFNVQLLRVNRAQPAE